MDEREPGNLYERLGVSRSATPEAIRKAFRRYALAHHPDKAPPERRERATREFQSVQQAYAVLSDGAKRTAYDAETDIRSAPVRHADVDEFRNVFTEFFGAPPDAFEFGCPRADLFARGAFGGGGAGLFGDGFGADIAPSTPSTTEAPLTLTLEELFKGGEKRLALSRRIYDGASGASVRVREEVTIRVQPGWQEGHRLTLAGKGDEAPGRGAGDVVLVVRQALHARFERHGDDLHARVEVPLLHALAGGPVPLQTLDGRALQVAAAGVITPESELLVRGEGMPRAKGGGRGDLRVRFRIAFPARLSALQLAQLQAVLA